MSPTPEEMQVMKKKLVVVGNGMAAGRVLEELFRLSPEGWDVTLFGAEPPPAPTFRARQPVSPVLRAEQVAKR